MSDDTLTKLAKIFSDVSGVDPSEVTPDKHVFEDLRIDSLDFLDITFDIDKTFSVKMPIEEWLAQVEQDKAAGEAIFRISHLVEFIDANKLAA